MTYEAEKTPAEAALDTIAQLCGCADWEYPGQVVRDVKAMRDLLVTCRVFLTKNRHAAELVAEIDKMLSPK